MSAMLARLFMSQAPNVAGGVVGGAVGVDVFSDVIDILKRNPIIPIASMSIVLIVVMKKK
jgi:hypothetical protein